MTIRDHVPAINEQPLVCSLYYINHLKQHPIILFSPLPYMLALFRITLTQRTLSSIKNLRFFSTTVLKAATMAQEYKLKDISSLSSILEKDGSKQEAEVEGIEKGKVLLIRSGGKIHATGAKCTYVREVNRRTARKLIFVLLPRHYGAPLVKGVVSSDGRLTCPWHGGELERRTVEVWLDRSYKADS